MDRLTALLQFGRQLSLIQPILFKRPTTIGEFRKMQTTAPTGPLAGYRVLDLTTVLFGPHGAQVLGDWGAGVIQVERLDGDTWRSNG
jgi:hypothetical protein